MPPRGRRSTASSPADRRTVPSSTTQIRFVAAEQPLLVDEAVARARLADVLGRLRGERGAARRATPMLASVEPSEARKVSAFGAQVSTVAATVAAPLSVTITNVNVEARSTAGMIWVLPISVVMLRTGCRRSRCCGAVRRGWRRGGRARWGASAPTTARAPSYHGDLPPPVTTERSTTTSAGLPPCRVGPLSHVREEVVDFVVKRRYGATSPWAAGPIDVRRSPIVPTW